MPTIVPPESRPNRKLRLIDMWSRAKRKQALRGRNHAEGSPGDPIDTLEIPARGAEDSLTESTLDTVAISGGPSLRP
jgi:hypothetical protein